MSNKYLFLTCLTFFSLNSSAGKLIVERSGDVVAIGNSNPNVRFIGSISNKTGTFNEFKIDRKKRKIIELPDCGICYFDINVGNTTSTYELDFNKASSFHIFTYPSNKTKKYLKKYQDIKFDDPITKTKSGIAKLKVISIKKISKNITLDADTNNVFAGEALEPPKIGKTVSASANTSKNTTQEKNLETSLIKLKELYEKGLISDEVYSKKIKEILNEI